MLLKLWDLQKVNCEVLCAISSFYRSCGAESAHQPSSLFARLLAYLVPGLTAAALVALGARNAVLIHRVSSRAIARRYTVRQVHTQPTVKFKFSKKDKKCLGNLPLDLKHYKNSFTLNLLPFCFWANRVVLGSTKISAIMLKYSTFETVSCFIGKKCFSTL